MDIQAQLKEKAEQIVKKLQSDKTLAARFAEDPVSVVEELMGIDLPNEQIQPLVDTVKAKLNLDKMSQGLGSLGKLFGK